MFCKNCGRELNNDMKFCDQCGTPTMYEAQSESSEDIATEDTAIIEKEENPAVDSDTDCEAEVVEQKKTWGQKTISEKVETVAGIMEDIVFLIIIAILIYIFHDDFDLHWILKNPQVIAHAFDLFIMIAIISVPFEAVKLVCFLASGEKKKAFKQIMYIIFLIVASIIAYHCWLNTAAEVVFYIVFAGTEIAIDTGKEASKSNQINQNKK